MHDLHFGLLVASCAVPAVITAENITSGDIDMQGFKALEVLVHVGAIVDALDANNKIELKIEHADDDGAGAAGEYAACTDADVLGWTGLTAGVYKTIDADTEDSKIYAIGYRGGRRFVKVTAVPTSIGTGGPLGIIALKGDPYIAPVSQQG